MSDFSIIHQLDALSIAILLFAGMLITMILGRFIALMWLSKTPEIKSGQTTLTTAMFGLSSFILAITFGMSGSRYDNIRHVFVEEANAIRTATLRSDLYADSIRKELRENFKIYLEARIALYKDLRDTQNFDHCKQIMDGASMRIWKRITDASKGPNMLIPSNNMVPAVTNMLDIGKKREVLLQTMIPDMIIYMLLILALICSFIFGVTSNLLSSRDRIVAFCFCFFTAFIIYITLELGRPLRGLIQARTSAEAINTLNSLFPE